MKNNFVTEFNELSENTFKKTSNGAKDGAPEVFVSLSPVSQKQQLR